MKRLTNYFIRRYGRDSTAAIYTTFSIAGIILLIYGAINHGQFLMWLLALGSIIAVIWLFFSGFRDWVGSVEKAKNDEERAARNDDDYDDIPAPPEPIPPLHSRQPPAAPYRPIDGGNWDER